MHEHTCGHASYQDIKTILTRINVWDDTTRLYIEQLSNNWPNFIITKPPKGYRPLSLCRMNAFFNDLVHKIHLFLDHNMAFFVMDSATRFTTGCVAQSTNYEEAILAFVTFWLTQIWCPGKIQHDKAFVKEEFGEFRKYLNISTKPTPLKWHNRNAIESK